MEAGIQGQSPGPSTEKFLTSKIKAVRIWGALSVALLAVGAQFFDQYCMDQLGTSINSLSLLLVVGLVTSCIRQVLYDCVSTHHNTPKAPHVCVWTRSEHSCMCVRCLQLFYCLHAPLAYHVLIAACPIILACIIFFRCLHLSKQVTLLCQFACWCVVHYTLQAFFCLPSSSLNTLAVACLHMPYCDFLHRTLQLKQGAKLRRSIRQVLHSWCTVSLSMKQDHMHKLTKRLPPPPLPWQKPSTS